MKYSIIILQIFISIVILEGVQSCSNSPSPSPCPNPSTIPTGASSSCFLDSSRIASSTRNIYTYNSLGQLSTVNKIETWASFPSNYTYDCSGWLTEISTNGSSYNTFAYDQSGKLNKIMQGSAVTSISYTSDTSIVVATTGYYLNGPNIISSTSQTYDPHGRLFGTSTITYSNFDSSLSPEYLLNSKTFSEKSMLAMGISKNNPQSSTNISFMYSGPYVVYRDTLKTNYNYTYNKAGFVIKKIAVHTNTSSVNTGQTTTPPDTTYYYYRGCN